MGWLTIEAGSSMPLGGFLAELLLSETEYRRQSRRIFDLPRLLLGLFFMTVGLRWISVWYPNG